MVSEKFKVLGELVRKLRTKPILVGGGAVEFYTSGAFVTGDLDIKGNRDEVIPVLEAMGFKRQDMYFIRGNIFIHLLPEYFDERFNDVLIKGTSYRVRVVSLEDLVVDRLNACKWWQSQRDCEQAKYLLCSYSEYLDRKYLEERARTEGVIDLLDRYLGQDPLKKPKKKIRKA